uniref:Sialin n=2 Tax=Ascaris TaxID=6251 RepID=A0A9J2P7I9_ASCLU
MYRLLPLSDDVFLDLGGEFRHELDAPASKWTLRRRHVVALLAFFGFANIYAMRANLSVAIVQMTTDTVRSINNTPIIVLLQKPEFEEWDSVTQGVILGAFFYGYIFTQIPGGYLAHLYGGKLVYLVGVFGTAVLTMLTPPIAHMGRGMLIATRFFEGLFEGVTYPAMHVMWSHWAPFLEKTRLASFAFSGSYFGTVFAMPVSAMLGYRLGWSFIFYFFGFLALIWCAIWMKNISELPEHDSSITTDELTLLQREAMNTNTYITPWRQILTSKAVWAIIVAHFCENWGFYTMLTSLPRILEDLLDYHLEKAGFFSALPYLVMGIVLMLSGNFADVLRDRYVWSTEKTRKYFCCLGFIGQALATIAATTHASATFVMIAIIVSVGVGGLPWSAFSVNHLDLAPQYAGHLMGLSNTVATLPGMISPIIVGIIVSEHSANEWRVVFYLTAMIYALGAAVYWRWASGQHEPWALGQTPFSETFD